MGVDDNTGLAEGIPKNDIRSLSADARQSLQFFHRVRDLLTETFGHGFGTSDKMFRLALKKTGGTNDLFDLREMSLCKFCRLPIPLKEQRGNLVDSLVGTLGGEDRGHEQLPRGTMIQFHLRVRHRSLKRLGYFS